MISFAELWRIRAYSCGYIYVYIRTYVFVWFGLVVCLYDWYAYEYGGSPSLFVEPLGSFVGGPPLLYLVEQEFISFTRR